MGTTPRGYNYPSDADDPAGPAQMQQLAEDIDADVQALDDRLSRAETGPIDVEVSTGSYTADSAVATAATIAAVDYDRVVECEVILNSSGVSAGMAWRTVLTRSTTGITTDVEATAAWAFTSSAVGGSCAFTASFDLPAGQTCRPRLWLDELTDGGSLTLSGPQRVRIRVRPKGGPA
jgi:hypothetical protein